MRLELLLGNKDKLRSILEVNKTIPSNAASYRKISDYFKHKPTSDIALIAPGGVESAYIVSEYLGSNVMIFHPAPLSKLVSWEPRIEGNIVPHHPLLIIDSKIRSGKILEQAKAYFQKKGYLAEHISVYANAGLPHEAAWPTLRGINEVLRECYGQTSPEENVMGLGPNAALI